MKFASYVNNVDWVKILRKAVRFLLPKYYNLLARIVVVSGLALILTGQVSVFHYFLVYVFEERILASELLKKLILESDSSRWFGLSLVFIGLLYHAVVTVAKGLSGTRYAASPTFQLGVVLNEGKVVFSEARLKAVKLILPPSEQLPDYEESSRGSEEKESFGSFFYSTPKSGFDRRNGSFENKHFHREKRAFLYNNSGFDCVNLELLNDSKLLGTAIKVELTVLGKAQIKVYRDFDLQPPEKRKSRLNPITVDNTSDIQLFECNNNLRVHHLDRKIEVTWNIPKIQANTSVRSKRRLYVKLESPVDLEYTIYCDQLHRPVTNKIRLLPTSDEQSVLANEILDDSKFSRLCSEYIAARSEEAEAF